MRAGYSYPGTQVGLGALRGGCALAKLSSTLATAKAVLKAHMAPTHARGARPRKRVEGGLRLISEPALTKHCPLAEN
jgi:hypothetical protein